MYYATCQGTNTIQTYINTASSSIGVLNNGLQTFTNSTLSPCYGDIYVTAMQVSAPSFDVWKHEFII